MSLTVKIAGAWVATAAVVAVIVAGGANPPFNTVLPAITGSAVTGETLTCSQGTWSPAGDSYARQWKRNAADIGGATASTRVLQVADEGQSITCAVTATNADGSTTATSNAVTPTAPGARPTGCFADPSACGYPDVENTGTTGALSTVPGAALPSGVSWDAPAETLRVETDNVVVENLDVPGGLTIDGDNVTVRNSRFRVQTGCASECGAFIIRIGQSGTPTTGTVLEDLELVTEEANPANDDPLDPATIDVKVDHAVRNNADQTVVADHLYVKGAGAAWKGPGTISDSYLYGQLVFAGDHVETVLNGGEGFPTHLIHNTMLNPVVQTAVVSLFDDFGPIADVLVEDNLMAGGGYVMYGGAKNNPANVTGPVIVRDNRFARGNQDSSGYYPNGGDFDLFASFNAAVTQSCGNFWDDDLSAIVGPGSSC